MRLRCLLFFLSLWVAASLGCASGANTGSNGAGGSGGGDGTGGTGEDPENLRPVADAGRDASAVVLSRVRLNGSGSRDPEGAPLSFTWALVQVPDQSQARLENADTVNPSFVPDRAGDYFVSLVVDDGDLVSQGDLVKIRASSDVDQPPFAVAGEDVETRVGQAVILNGRMSWDPEGQPLTYAWTLVGRPAGSTAGVNGPTSQAPSLLPDVAGTYRLHLVVRDGANESEPDEVAVIASENGGAVNAGPDLQVTIGESVTIQASSTLSCGGDHQWWDWELTTRPATSRLYLYGSSASVQFLPDVCGSYVVRVEASCGSERDEDEVVIEVSPPSGGGETSVLGYRAIDAEASRSLDKIVLVSEGPAALHLVDPATGSETAVALPQRPAAVSVSPDGREAVVGHDGWVSIVDLEAMTVSATWPAGLIVGDIVHGGNGWVYAFPLGSGFGPIRAIEVATGRHVESQANAVTGNWGQRLSATALLSVRSGDLIRIDLAADGTPTVSWRWYDFDYRLGEKFWVAADGARLFGNSGVALWMGDGTAETVTYAGSLSGYRPTHLAHAPGIGRIALVGTGTGAGSWQRTSDVVLLEDGYLAEQEVRTMPWIEYDGAWKQVFGRFVFFDVAESRLVVVADLNSSTPFPGDPLGPDVLVRIEL